jgi:K(+)-stimulated pyrophosphate-energized sodium pump
MNSIAGLIPYIGLLGLAFAAASFVAVVRKSPGNERMQEVAGLVHDGAMAFLRREYQILSIFVIVVAGLIAWQLNVETAECFVAGAICSLAAGFIGMQAATRANCRTSEAARAEGAGAALLVAFGGGSVMGLAVAGLGLLGVGALALVFAAPEQASYINGFAMGASSIALFARVGGGIFTKAADVGADLVGKVEAGIPEDDPRNPGVIADNVGDNVGDVAGMGADIFESYVGAMVASMAIAATLGPEALTLLAGSLAAGDALKSALIGLPLALSAVGLGASLLGILSMQALKSMGPAAALRYSAWGAAVLFLIGSWALVGAVGISQNVFFAVLAGTIAGVLIGYITEYYTSMGPVAEIAEASRTGAATNIITGLAVGFRSCAAPLFMTRRHLCFHQMAGLTASAGCGRHVGHRGYHHERRRYGPIADNSQHCRDVRFRSRSPKTLINRFAGQHDGGDGQVIRHRSPALAALALFSAYNQAIDAAQRQRVWPRC